MLKNVSLIEGFSLEIDNSQNQSINSILFSVYHRILPIDRYIDINQINCNEIYTDFYRSTTSVLYSRFVDSVARKDLLTRKKFPVSGLPSRTQS